MLSDYALSSIVTTQQARGQNTTMQVIDDLAPISRHSNIDIYFEALACSRRNYSLDRHVFVSKICKLCMEKSKQESSSDQITHNGSFSLVSELEASLLLFGFLVAVLQGFSSPCCCLGFKTTWLRSEALRCESI